MADDADPKRTAEELLGLIGSIHAKMKDLPPELQEEIGKALSPSKPRAKPGPKKGSGRDYSRYLDRMADLKCDNPSLRVRAISRHVAEEAAADGLHVHPDTLRHPFCSHMPELLAGARARKEASEKAAMEPRAAGGPVSGLDAGSRATPLAEHLAPFFPSDVLDARRKIETQLVLS